MVESFNITPGSTPSLSLPLPSEQYYAMVVDSGPIIKQDVRNLMGKAQTYVTTPSVLREIRDSKARDYMEHSVLPLLDLQVREPTDKAIQDVIAFAKQTGDYAGLSTVDLQVLALTLDLEREGNLARGNTDLGHIRTTPKRKIGLGAILPMNGKSNANPKPAQAAPTAADAAASQEEKKGEDDAAPKLLGREDYDEVEESDDDDDDEGEDSGEGQPVPSTAAPQSVTVIPPSTDPKQPVKKSWAGLVNPTAASTIIPSNPTSGLPFAKMSLKQQTDNKVSNASDAGGVFDDASEDEDDPQNAEAELQLEFPSLIAASTVAYEGEDDEIDARGENNEATINEEGAIETSKAAEENPHHKTKASVFMTEEEKQQNLSRVSKSGRSYNSFRKYKGLMKPKQPKKKPDPVEEEDEVVPQLLVTNTEAPKEQQSTRFLSGGGGGETMHEEDDDGQGWITSSEDIKIMKAEGGGRLDPGKTGTIGGQDASDTKNANNTTTTDPTTNTNTARQTKKPLGPPMDQRTACATTDFAMQNVLLQMNLILLSTEGMRIRRLKSWVIRCGACFKIHGADQDFKDETNHFMKRLFCSHCGSGDMMQRISASVDGKTGRLKLHFSKRKQGRHHSIRGTKFSLPKPGSGNKYKGDLLLREDQLLSGAWNQKVKINSGRKYQTSKSQSMFGRDIASSVGCNVNSTSSATFGGKGWASTGNTSSNGGFGTSTDDIRVGFGARKNPNAAKGRERRGKKKTSKDRACGMRRY
jgi:RNA-binding protein NOB1